MLHPSIKIAAGILLLLATLHASPAFAVGALDCRRHDCSNDAPDLSESQSEPILGDEQIAWRPLVEWSIKSCPANSVRPCIREETRRCYEIALYPDETVVHRICEMERANILRQSWDYIPPGDSFFPYATDEANHPHFGMTYRYIVRACEGEQCSEWSPKTSEGDQDYVEIIGADYACFGSERGARCEKRCYAGAKKMFPEIPDCADPF